MYPSRGPAPARRFPEGPCSAETRNPEFRPGPRGAGSGAPRPAAPLSPFSQEGPPTPGISSIPRLPGRPPGLPEARRQSGSGRKPHPQAWGHRDEGEGLPPNVPRGPRGSHRPLPSFLGTGPQKVISDTSLNLAHSPLLPTPAPQLLQRKPQAALKFRGVSPSGPSCPGWAQPHLGAHLLSPPGRRFPGWGVGHGA